MAIGPKPSIALWAVTPNGLKLAQRLRDRWPAAALFYTKKLADRNLSPGANPLALPFATPFDRLTETVAGQFSRYDGHIFIMATGIVVRSIAPLLNHKTVDPAVGCPLCQQVGAPQMTGRQTDGKASPVIHHNHCGIHRLMVQKRCNGSNHYAGGHDENMAVVSAELFSHRFGQPIKWGGKRQNNWIRSG